ncbi:MAG: protein kinase [Anaerolineae bacterium]|nr:protein kinase [Anaerolineae bacterium]
MPEKNINHYQIVGPIGQGGMATVYRAYDPRFKREVAIKLLPHALMHDPTFRARFEREAQTIASLEHPAIVPVYDYGEAEGQPFLVMRLMTGGSLSDRLAAGPLPMTEVARIFKRLAPALDAAHKQGIIHRDLKPGNILFDQWDEPYLADFGIAKLTEGDDSPLTATGGTVGTPAYMSPEQVQGNQLDGRSDVYALGVILFEMLTGRRPYEATTPMAIALKHITDPIPPLPLANLPQDSQMVINKALAKAPAQRYETASLLAQDITALTGDQTVTSSTPPVPHPETEVMIPAFTQKGAAAPPISVPPPSPPPPLAPAPKPAASSTSGRKLPVWLLAGGGLVALALCGGLIILALVYMASSGSPTPTRVASSTNTPEPTTAPTPANNQGDVTPEPITGSGRTVLSLEEAAQGVVQIIAQGTFRDPALGTLTNSSGYGSGFIIDGSGIAVTNNHVVAGAAFLRVYVAGETRPRNARILGTSECADLAVIAIDGSDFTYLTWYKGPLDVGLNVYAAGFPLGDSEFTLTRGVISKADANGETSWASVNRVLEHDATLNLGNSGGPLLDAAGQVVGINYALARSTSQYFAISAPDAISLVDQLRQGQNLASIGVNGLAVQGDGVSGIWVSAVISGSPADRAGVRPGDIITMLEGFVLATDGTMSSYCNILRGRAATDVMSIQVLRYDTGQILDGQLNGTPVQ